MEPTEEPLPPAPLTPGTSVLIPLATVVPKISHTRRWWRNQLAYDLLDGERYSMVNQAVVEEALDVWGPSRLPVSVDTDAGAVPVHAFDPSLTYTVDRTWAMGSCPHVFAVGPDRARTYLGTLFGRRQRHEQTGEITVPDRTAGIEIAELEEEATFIRRVTLDGHVIDHHRWLSQGTSVVYDVAPGQVIELTGYYVADPRSDLRHGLSARTMRVREHLRRYERERPGLSGSSSVQTNKNTPAESTAIDRRMFPF